jgi:RNA polymerase sigma-70 factor (ECF subfamily)
MALLPDQILRARAGDERALEALIRAYQEPVARLVVAKTGTGEHYEDLCQAVFVKVVLGLSSLKSADSLEAWLFQIARNVCNDHLRRLRWKRRLFRPLDPGEDAVAVEETASLGLEAEAVQGAMAQLTLGQQRLLALSIERPRSYEELARLQNLSVPALKSRLFRARDRLRQLLKRESAEREIER